ncbi:DUF6011 domain-containing protein [Tsukamurella tyrosinosolvens]
MSALADAWRTGGGQWIRVRLCEVCGKPLTAPRSAKLGIGPQCARRIAKS